MTQDKPRKKWKGEAFTAHLKFNAPGALAFRLFKRYGFKRKAVARLEEDFAAVPRTALEAELEGEIEDRGLAKVREAIKGVPREALEKLLEEMGD